MVEKADVGAVSMKNQQCRQGHFGSGLYQEYQGKVLFCLESEKKTLFGSFLEIVTFYFNLTSYLATK